MLCLLDGAAQRSMAALASSKYAALGGVPVGIAPAVGVSCGRSWMGMEALLSSYTIPEAASRAAISASYYYGPYGSNIYF